MPKLLAALLPVVLASLVGAMPALAWTWPADGPVLEPFAIASDPYAGGQHRGIDIAAPSGTTVLAPASGIASFAGAVPGGGRTLTIQTDDGYAVTLLHLGTIDAAEGQSVAEGDPVATIGPTGAAEHPEPYVHLGVRSVSDPNGYVDPAALLPPRGTLGVEVAPAEPALSDSAGDAPAATAPDTAPADTPPGEGTADASATALAEPQGGEGAPPEEVTVVREPVEPIGPPEPVRPPEPATPEPVVPAAVELQASPPRAAPESAPPAAGGSGSQVEIPNATAKGHATAAPSPSAERAVRTAPAESPGGADDPLRSKALDARKSAARPQLAAGAREHARDVEVEPGDRVRSQPVADSVEDAGPGPGLPPFAWVAACVLVVGGVALVIRRRGRPQKGAPVTDARDQPPGSAVADRPHLEQEEAPEMSVAPIAIRLPLPGSRERSGPERRPSARAARNARRASV